MQALTVTILISLCLAGIFVVSFVLESKRRRNTSSSPEHDALLPFDEGKRKSPPAEPDCSRHEDPKPEAQA